ncbi:MAG: hypothetical protein C0631_07670 [Sedimenticola sp.]|jgi:hypothetical protein|nr:MAG: hypothetical protein C0631_07670 [Sedimenticola sp.]
MPKYLVDPETDIVERQYAVIYTPRKQRERFPENCVEVFPTQEEALQHADPAQNRHPAYVYGPCRSSEGFRLFYLVEWL